MHYLTCLVGQRTYCDMDLRSRTIPGGQDENPEKDDIFDDDREANGGQFSPTLLLEDNLDFAT